MDVGYIKVEHAQGDWSGGRLEIVLLTVSVGELGVQSIINTLSTLGICG